MTANKRYQLKQEQLDYPIVNFYSDLVDTENNDKVICSFDNDVGTSKMVDLLNELSEKNEKLKKYNKSQELEIIRLHNLADAMSAVLRELGIYDVYNDEQIENVKRRIMND